MDCGSRAFESSARLLGSACEQMNGQPQHSSTIAIAFGDAGGIGPEVALKAVAGDLSVDDSRYLLIGDESLVHSLNEQLGLRLDIRPAAEAKPTDRVTIFNPLPATLPHSALRNPHSPEAARAAIAWLTNGAELCLRGEAAALVTAPVNKESIINSGEHDFVGQTELLSALAKTDRTAMMLLGCDDRQRWLREITTILPAVEAARSRGLDVVGPLAADTLFHYAFRGDYDAVVAMYHDQGLVPLKMIGFDTGVNWTLGLPFIRTSPDHGTAYDIAGQGIANPSSMIAALRLAKKLARA